jgi:hypothetical protein
MKSQQQTIKHILETKGKVNNFDAIMKLGIWRLGAVICLLRKEGMKIEGDYMIKNKVRTKIYEYKLIK